MRPTVSIVIVFILFAVASCSSGTSSSDTDPVGEPSSSGDALAAEVAAWCGLEQPPFELDPGDPASVEAGFTQSLAFDLLRAEQAPSEIADALRALVAETERITEVLEANDWDLLGDAVQAQIDLPPDAQAAADQVYRFEVDVCGKPDTRTAVGD